jgi:ribosomal protein S18 acetylase RimI-like enzyme
MSVRPVTAADAAPLGDVLGRAFDDDPLFRAILPDDAHRARALPVLFRQWILRLHVQHGASWTTDDHAGAALWSPPGHWHISWLDEARMAPPMVAALGSRAVAGLRVLLAVEGPHPKEPPHYYLRVLGCEPARQGRGIGAELLRPVLERCDAEGLGAYLESSNPKNLTFYRRHGFEAIGEVTTHLGPKAWLMWRKPRSDRDASS